MGAVHEYVDAVLQDGEQARVTFIARSQWQGGTLARVRVGELLVAGQNVAGEGRNFVLHCDEPPALGGRDQAPNPVELLAAGLCGCLTAGIATNAALFDTALEKLEVEVRCDWDMRGVLGLDKTVPNQAQGIHYTVRLKGKPGVGAEQLRRCKETLDRKSAVLNTLLNAVPASTDIIIEP